MQQRLRITGPRTFRTAAMVVVALLCASLAQPAQADLDGHGPDGWRVTGVSPGDVLNARMGPGIDYPIIEAFDHDERGLQQITCVPFYTMTHFQAMSEAELAALPASWCLMRDAAMLKAGWVAQRFLMPDDAIELTGAASEEAGSDDGLIVEAEQLVRDLYSAHAGGGSLEPSAAAAYFTADIVDHLASGGFGADPLFGAQDFDGTVDRIARDPDEPMFRGMITINVDFTNFGQAQRAVFYLRADTTQPGAPLRIFRVEHEGWGYP